MSNDYSNMQVHRHNTNNIITGAKYPVKEWTVDVPVAENARKQLFNVANMPFIHKHVAAMPDVHWGMGATVGSVIPTHKAIVPAAVGVDIGCVDADTEFLTPSGWKRIADYQKDDKVLVFDAEAEEAFFEQPKYVKLECDQFWHIKTKYGVNQMLSDEHKVLYYKHTRKYDFIEQDTISALDLAEKHNSLKLGFRGRFLTSFDYFNNKTSVELSDAQIRVMVMACADGHFGSKSTRCTLKLSKDRKISRAKELLKDAGVEFEHDCDDVLPVHTIKFYAPERFKSLSYFWKASPYQLKIICDEVFHWDGNFDDSVFFTRDKASADFMSFAFAACGKRSVMQEDKHYRDGKSDYRVFAHSNTKIGIAATPERQDFIRVPSPDGFKYCFTTSTGYWVMRRKGVIAVTGNCGMMAVQTTLSASQLPDNLAALRNDIESVVPHGRTDNGGVNDKGSWMGKIPGSVETAWMGMEPKYKKLLERHPKLLTKQEPHNQLGSLGGGNHFIEVCLDENDKVWVMLHSGSRGIGNRIGTHFIQLAKKEMERWFINNSLPDINLSYLAEGSQHFDDYVEAVGWAQNFARENRELMMKHTLKAIKKCRGIPRFETVDYAINCHHNYVEKEFHFGKSVWVTRKGAIRAREGDLGIIPGSMGARSYIVRGLGNADSFCSASHGAGRVMSREEAKRTFSIDDHKKATEGVECKKDSSVIDETPGAYKDIDAVMKAQENLVEVVHTLKQVLCVKG